MIILAYEALNNIVEVVGMFSIKAMTVVKSIHTQIVEGLNQKGFLSQNCLFICNFDMFFTYILTG